MSFHWKHLRGNEFDVWVGTGWDGWSRIKVGRDYASVIEGYRILPKTMQEIVNSINS